MAPTEQPGEAQLREALVRVDALISTLEGAGLLAGQLAEVLPGAPGEGFGSFSVELYNCATELREAFASKKEAFGG